MRLPTFCTSAVLALGLVVAAGRVFAVDPEPTASSPAEVGPIDQDTRQLIWQAILRALASRGMVTNSASFEQGLVMTEFAPLEGTAIEHVALLSDAERTVHWTSGEYRYVVDIGDVPGKLRLAVRVEIRAWAQDAASAPQADVKHGLSSNRTLEKEFLQAFSLALSQGGEQPATGKPATSQ